MLERISTSVETDKLKTRDGVIALIESSQSRRELSQGIEKVIEANGGTFPPFWKEASFKEYLDEKFKSFRTNVQ
ncbi:hypothetical protein HYZ82_00070 [Candidatus Nomurabacteria bacterium]|nr:hypothetical protein [Candidatus Nomurabacteria bacterium]